MDNTNQPTDPTQAVPTIQQAVASANGAAPMDAPVPTAPVVDPANAPIQEPTPTPMPVDPMDNPQVPNLPMAPVAPEVPAAQMPAPDMTMSQQVAPQPQVAAVAPAPQPMPSIDSAVSTPASSPDPVMPLAPVTMEDLMEELQHIEDKLDEMDEKL